MNIIKRNGSEAIFNKDKIIKALTKANDSMEEQNKLSSESLQTIADKVEQKVKKLKTIVNIELIQNLIEEELMAKKAFALARNYITYRYQHELDRKGNAFDSRVLSIADGTNEEVIQENSNKDPRMAAVQRDYFASEISADIARRLIFSKEEIQAHDAGIIHIHDLGYAASKIFNCCLVNLDDMLQNGTVITGTLIEKPKSFSVACTIATQIVGQIASAQYGGQTISLAHLSPFVDVSRQKFKKELEKNQKELGIEYTTDQFNSLLDKMVKRDIEIGIQTIQYQVTTMMTSNGQAAFLSEVMCLGEQPEGQPREDLALVIEEVLKQRILGTKNQQGVYVTPAFPKLLYILDDYNVTEGSKYYYLTKLAAECTSKRMVPDYISAKKMRELKKGQVYGCMGSVAPREVVTYKIGDKILVESIERMWDRLEAINSSSRQPTTEKDRYIALKNVSIYDNKENKFVNCSCITKNWANEFIQVTIGSYTLEATLDHKFETENRGEIFGYELQIGDKIIVSNEQASINNIARKNHIENVVKTVKVSKAGWSYDVTTESHHFEVSGIYSHNCRSFLTPEPEITNPDGSMKFYGRFNMGVCTINLVDVALSSGKDFNKFWEILTDRCELCHKVLQKRIERLRGTKACVSPIHWQFGAIARLNPNDTIDQLMHSGYATISLGYAGLYEAVYYLIGESLTTDNGLELGKQIMEFLNKCCRDWREAEGYAYSVYGTPIETTTYRFAKCLKERFGVIDHVTDKNYITNSYHIHVTEDIDIFTKFKIESQLQELSPGGCISYGECPNMVHNQQAVLNIIKYIYDTIMYAELNMKLDTCQTCGYEGEMEIQENADGKLYWSCPSCGNTDEKKMNIARRVCGYISSNGFNQGRTQEIKERVLHI